MAEAAAQLQKGLDQLALLPNGPERRLQELEFYSALGAALLAVKGQASSETGRAYALALGLWEQLGSPRSSFTFSGDSRLITRTAANWIWRCAWRRDCYG